MCRSSDQGWGEMPAPVPAPNSSVSLPNKELGVTLAGLNCRLERLITILSREALDHRPQGHPKRSIHSFEQPRKTSLHSAVPPAQ